MKNIFFPIVSSCIFMSLSTVANSATIWDGSSLEFTRAENVVGTNLENLDQITDSVWIGRATGGGAIENALVDDFSDNFTLCSGLGGPSDTEFAFGNITNYDTLNYGTFLSSAYTDCSPGNFSFLNQSSVLHLISEDIYIPITFTSWGSGGNGAFSYIRGTSSAVPEPASLALLTLGLAGFSFQEIRKKLKNNAHRAQNAT